jgi:diguanylate cyclase (GGDEF)-like protein
VYDPGALTARQVPPEDPGVPRHSDCNAEGLVSEPRGAGFGPLTVLSAGAAALARARDLDVALSVIVEAGAAATGAAVASVFAFAAEGGELELLLTLGMSDEDVAAYAPAVTGNRDHPVHHAALNRAGSLGRSDAMPGGAPMTAVDLPLVAGGGIETAVGVLTFGWPGTHEVDTAEETLLVAVADLAASAVAAHRSASLTAERGEWLERMAHTDPLTGLSNARTIGHVLELELARAQRAGTEVSVAVFDIDGFTELNEAAGSRAGDRVLREVAAVLAESVRLVDGVARTDGDEFLVVAPGAGGSVVARRVLDGVARLPEVEGHPITVSAAIARYPQDGTDGDALVAAARARLAEAPGPAAIIDPGVSAEA